MVIKYGGPQILAGNSIEELNITIAMPAILHRESYTYTLALLNV